MQTTRYHYKLILKLFPVTSIHNCIKILQQTFCMKNQKLENGLMTLEWVIHFIFYEEKKTRVGKDLYLIRNYASTILEIANIKQMQDVLTLFIELLLTTTVYFSLFAHCSVLLIEI